MRVELNDLVSAEPKHHPAGHGSPESRGHELPAEQVRGPRSEPRRGENQQVVGGVRTGNPNQRR